MVPWSTVRENRDWEVSQHLPMHSMLHSVGLITRRPVPRTTIREENAVSTHWYTLWYKGGGRSNVPPIATEGSYDKIHPGIGVKVPAEGRYGVFMIWVHRYLLTIGTTYTNYDRTSGSWEQLERSDAVSTDGEERMERSISGKCTRLTRATGMEKIQLSLRIVNHKVVS